MKITHNKVGQNLNLTDTNKAKGSQKSSDVEKINSDNVKKSAATAVSSADASAAAPVNLSKRGQEINKAKELAKNAPDVREDRIAALQKSIDAGTYKVSATDIADKMVDEESQWS